MDNNFDEKILRQEKIFLKKVNTVIGSNTIFRGNFVVDGAIRIDGNYEGYVKSLDMVIIGSTAKVKGNVYGSIVIVGGKVKGDIFAVNEIILLGTSFVFGSLCSQKILIDEGARFKGKFSRVSAEEINKIFDEEVKPYIEQEKEKWVW
ncbi:MAG: polymer-forming cytoskeletal protein [Brevinematia bacterium]